MKVAITGHTKRIGKAIYDAFPNSIGLSKSQGFDITDKNSRTKIVHAINDCDVFINNAHEGFGQVELLNDVFTAWKDYSKLIINIGVDTVPYSNWQVVHQQYPVEKVALHSQVELLHNQQRKCKITTLGLGYVDTEFNKDYDGAKLSYKDIVETIKWIIDQSYEVKQLMVSAK
jgi:hypothetical protein